MNSTSIFGTVGIKNVNKMLASTVYEYSRMLIERVIPGRFKERKTEEYMDISIELRRQLASEIAYAEFKKRKDRALTDNHRASFIR